MYARILVPVDGSPTSDQGLAEAMRLAGLCKGRIRLLHVVDLLSFALLPEAGVAMTQEFFDQLRAGGEAVLVRARASVEAAGLPVETRLVEGAMQRVSDVVIDEARQWNAEVTALGMHGRRGVGRALLGSDAEQIVRNAPVPVLLVRGREPS